ncbi:unnamed protein product [Leuciscus chuanchicus]
MKRKSIDQFFQPKKTLKEQESEHVKEQTDRLSEEDVEVDKGTDEDCEVAVEEEMSDSNNKETERELGDVRLSSQEQLDAAKSVFTSTEGYRNWKKASFKDSGFSSHAKSENHQNAMCAWAENKKRLDSNTSLVAIMDEKNKKQLTENQNYVKALAEILIVTATENTAQRGHRETTDSERKDHLQSKDIDFSKAVNLIKAFKDTLDDYRSEDTFGELWNNIVDTCHQSNISTTQNKSKRVRQTTKALQDSIIASTLGQHVSPDGKTSFRDKVYYPVIDHMKGEVERRFSKTNCDIMNGLQALNPSSRSFLGDDVMLFAKAYGSNADDLKHEIHQCKRVLERLKNEEKDSPATLMDYTQFMEQYKDVFYELYRLCKIAVVIPLAWLTSMGWQLGWQDLY